VGIGFRMLMWILDVDKSTTAKHFLLSTTTTNVAKKKKCVICGEVVEPKGIYSHTANNHPEYVEKWE